MKHYKYTRIYKVRNDPTWENAALVQWRDENGIEHEQHDHKYPAIVKHLESLGYERSDRWDIKEQPTEKATP